MWNRVQYCPTMRSFHSRFANIRSIDYMNNVSNFSLLYKVGQSLLTQQISIQPITTKSFETIDQIIAEILNETLKNARRNKKRNL